MPVLGLVIKWSGASSSRRKRAREAMARHPLLTPGSARDGRLPLVLEGADCAQIDAALEELSAIDAVARVDVVYVNFEDLVTSERPGNEDTPWT